VIVNGTDTVRNVHVVAERVVVRVYIGNIVRSVSGNRLGIRCRCCTSLTRSTTAFVT
jgi:hypothetical protein